ncbi:MAG: hypothetical protein ACRDYC_00420 [Acidimicrobiales bacterium]
MSDFPAGGETGGEWHLWVYFGDWVLREGDQVLATNWDDYPIIDTAIERFDGRRVYGVRVDPEDVASRAVQAPGDWSRLSYC